MEEIALKNNLDILGSLSRLEGGGFDVESKQKLFYPSVTFSSNVNTGQNDYCDCGMNSLLEITQPLYDKAAQCAISQSKIERDRRCFQLRKQICDTLFAVRSAYFTYLLHLTHLEIDREVIQVWKNEVTRQEKRLQLGSSIPLELAQTKLHLKEANIDLNKTESSVCKSRIDLLYVCGFPPNASVIFLNEFTPYPPSTLNTREMERWKQIAFENSPDLKDAQLACESAKMEVSKIKGEHWPTLSAYASAGHNYIYNGFAFQPALGAGVNLDWMLYDPTNKPRLKAAQEALKGSGYGYSLLELQIEGTIYALLNEIEKNAQSYLVAKEGSSLAEESVQIALKKTEQGLMSPFEYRDLIDQWHFAKQQESQALYDWRVSYATLIRFVGFDFFTP